VQCCVFVYRWAQTLVRQDHNTRDLVFSICISAPLVSHFPSNNTCSDCLSFYVATRARQHPFHLMAEPCCSSSQQVSCRLHLPC
jgi:hypothetical protein